MTGDEVDEVVTAWARERDDLALEPMHIWSRIDRLAGILAGHRKRAFSAHAIEGWEFDVLAALRRAGAPWRLTPSALFKSLVRSSGGMTKQLDKLANEGLIARVPDDDDRRSLLVELTEKGLTLVDHALTDHMANEKSVLAKLNPAQTKSLAKALQVMIDQLI